MSRFQPTVRQLQPLRPPRPSAPIVHEQADARVQGAEAGLPAPTADARRRPRWRRRLAVA